MKATETNLLKFLEAPKQLIIPIYQRTYSWQLKQCEQFWNDIVRVGKDEAISGHFLGSIVYIEHGLYQVAALTQLLVIDGQQRLTTALLLLLALRNALRKSEPIFKITPKKINNLYLLNDLEEGEKRFKLILTQTDKQTLINIIESE